MAKIYDGPSDEKCPLWRSLCSKVCPTCKWQTQIRGKNPNTGQDIDRWDCAIPFQLLIGIEISKNALNGAAATDNLRNQSAEQFHQSTQMAVHMMRVGTSKTSQLANGQVPLTIEAKVECPSLNGSRKSTP